MKCKYCGETIRRIRAGLDAWVHVIEVPGTSRTSATYTFCRMTIALPAVEPEEVSTEPDEWCSSKHVHHPGCYK